MSHSFSATYTRLQCDPRGPWWACRCAPRGLGKRVQPSEQQTTDLANVIWVIPSPMINGDRLTCVLSPPDGVAVTRPTEPGITGRAARGFYDVFLIWPVSPVGWALPELRIGLQFVATRL